MYVAADNPVVALCPGVAGRGLLEALNVPEARANAELDPFDEGPVRLAQMAADIVYGVVQRHNNVVQGIAQARHPWGASNDPIEAVPVCDQQPLPERRPVDPLPVHFELAV